MNRMQHFTLGCALCMVGAAAHCALPPPTAQQLAVAQSKKAAADAQAKLDQQALLTKMDELAGRWRANARANGWAVPEPVPVAAPIEALKAPAMQTPAPSPAPAPSPTPAPGPAPASKGGV